MARSLEVLPKKLAYVNSGVKWLLRTDVREQLKVIALGQRAFDRQNNKAGHAAGRRRPCSEEAMHAAGQAPRRAARPAPRTSCCCFALCHHI